MDDIVLHAKFFSIPLNFHVNVYRLFIILNELKSIILFPNLLSLLHFLNQFHI